MTDGAVLVFSRTPLPGTVKSRLVPVLGAAGAADLYRGLVRRTLDTARRAAPAAIELWCTPDPGDEFLRDFAVSHGVTLHSQQGGDLGERMERALAEALQRHPCAVLVGCDCPELEPADLRRAVSALAAGAQVVLGPAKDGGYYLVGMGGGVADIFRDIDWGTARVMAQTRERLRQRSIAHVELASRRDLDDAADLAHYLASAGVPPAA